MYQVYAGLRSGYHAFCPSVTLSIINLHPDNANSLKIPLFEVPSIREYYVDLDYVLSVISDGPTKSFAFRRLKYLTSKWSMYSLLNEYQETADMKVGGRAFFFFGLRAN